IWNLASGKIISSFESGFESSQLRGLSFINTEHIVAWGVEPTVKIWDIGGRTVTVPPGLGDASISQLAVSPDGTTLAFTAFTTDATLQTWSLKDGKARSAVTLDTTQPEGCSLVPAYSPDGRYIAWPNRDGTIQLYGSDTLKKLRSLGAPSKHGV